MMRRTRLQQMIPSRRHRATPGFPPCPLPSSTHDNELRSAVARSEGASRRHYRVLPLSQPFACLRVVAAAEPVIATMTWLALCRQSSAPEPSETSGEPGERLRWPLMRAAHRRRMHHSRRRAWCCREGCRSPQ
eukprot:scaffold30729_cov111-Isochrysis_galbana.AAC.2